MNNTKIENIIDRNGIDGWDGLGKEVCDALTKTFKFDSFEQAQHFAQEVGKFAELNDHHPEWNTSNGGKNINVKLTSHFNNNTVTLLDFELAEQMNKQFGQT
jgi:4a-hydroxytetrahydrobiopterin dehydratase